MTRRPVPRACASPYLILVLGLSALAGPAAAQDSSSRQSRPALFDRLVGCRATEDPAIRLTCFDTAVASLDEAERQGEVIVVDRAQVSAARRQLFGVDIPSMPSLFDRSGRADPLEAIETTLVRATRFGNDMWLFTLADGSVWRQVDVETFRFSQRAGQTVRVRRAAMGSYLLTVDNGRALRVRRQTE